MNRVMNAPSSRLVLTGIALAAVVAVAVSALLISRADAVRYDESSSSARLPSSSVWNEPVETESDIVAQNSIGFSNGTVSITRSASVAVESDHAVLNLGVEAIGATVGSARQSAAERMEAVLEAMEEAGIDGDDIATSMFEIVPQTEWVEDRTDLGDGNFSVRNRSRIVGYAVRNEIMVTVTDLESVGSVIDAAAEAAGDLFRVPSIRFGASDRDAAVDQARILAARDARRVAELHASTLGFVLGPVVAMVEYGGAAPIGAQFDARVATAESLTFDTPIVPGDVDISVTVEVKFAILGAAVTTSGQ